MMCLAVPGKVIEIFERDGTRMAHVDFGISVISSSIFFRYRASRVIDLADVSRELSLRGELAGFEVSERFYEIGSPRGIRDTEQFLSRRGTEKFLPRQWVDA